ncbi:hypothetical protein ACUD7I_16285 [Enterococcus casseliflavus]|uniref:hypothetical protein n=1 Tax=Enterococcus casseliflavus TaxID=37734 RepID=UPI00403D40A5
MEKVRYAKLVFNLELEKIKNKKRDGKISELDLTYSSESHTNLCVLARLGSYVSGWIPLM